MQSSPLLLSVAALTAIPFALVRGQDWKAVLDAPPGTTCMIDGTVKQERQFAAAGDSCVRLQSGGATLTATVTGPALASFRWRASTEETMDYVAVDAGQGEVLRLSGRTGWNDSGPIPLGAGNRTLTWKFISSPSIVCGDDAVWVDALATSPVTSVSAIEALDYTGTVTLNTAAIPARWGAWAADGVDAVAVPGSTQLAADVTIPGPGWLRWRARGSSGISNLPGASHADPLGPPASNGWSEGRRAWIPWAGTLTLTAYGGLDTLSRDSGSPVTLSDALDSPGTWTSPSAYPLRIPELAHDGDDFVALSLNGSVTLTVTGPVAVSFWHLGDVRLTANGSTFDLNTVPGWHQETVIVGPGSRTLGWVGLNTSEARLDSVKLEPLTSAAAALDYSGPVTSAGAVAGTTAAAYTGDGQDALLLGPGGAVAVPVIGPGSLQFRCRCRNLPLEVRAGNQVMVSGNRADLPGGEWTRTARRPGRPPPNDRRNRGSRCRWMCRRVITRSPWREACCLRGSVPQ